MLIRLNNTPCMHGYEELESESFNQAVSKLTQTITGKRKKIIIKTVYMCTQIHIRWGPWKYRAKTDYCMSTSIEGPSL